MKRGVLSDSGATEFKYKNEDLGDIMRRIRKIMREIDMNKNESVLSQLPYDHDYLDLLEIRSFFSRIKLYEDLTGGKSFVTPQPSDIFFSGRFGKFPVSM
jgi:hypothetical protein